MINSQGLKAMCSFHIHTVVEMLTLSYFSLLLLVC
jgi:hypothetical protein